MNMYVHKYIKMCANLFARQFNEWVSEYRTRFTAAATKVAAAAAVVSRFLLLPANICAYRAQVFFS